MSQLRLLEVPPDRPSTKARIDAFKVEHRIWTHRATGWKRIEHPWSALLVPKEVNYDELSVMEYIAGYCRLADEGGWLVTGEGELTAIRRLCNNVDIICDL